MVPPSDLFCWFRKTPWKLVRYIYLKHPEKPSWIQPQPHLNLARYRSSWHVRTLNDWKICGETPGCWMAQETQQRSKPRLKKFCQDIEGSQKGVPQNGWFIMENPSIDGWFSCITSRKHSYGELSQSIVGTPINQPLYVQRIFWLKPTQQVGVLQTISWIWGGWCKGDQRPLWSWS